MRALNFSVMLYGGAIRDTSHIAAQCEYDLRVVGTTVARVACSPVRTQLLIHVSDEILQDWPPRKLWSFR